MTKTNKFAMMQPVYNQEKGFIVPNVPYIKGAINDQDQSCDEVIVNAATGIQLHSFPNVI